MIAVASQLRHDTAVIDLHSLTLEFNELTSCSWNVMILLWSGPFETEMLLLKGFDPANAINQ